MTSLQELTKVLLESNDFKALCNREDFIQDTKRLWEKHDADHINQIERSVFLRKGGLTKHVLVFEKTKHSGIQ